MGRYRLKQKFLPLLFIVLIVTVSLLWFGFNLNVQAQSNNAASAAPVIHSFAINNGDATTALHGVTLQLDVTDSQTDSQQLQVRYRNSPGDWSPWAPYSAEVDWLLSPGDGSKQVDVEVKNLADITATASAAIRIFVPVEGVILNYSLLVFHPGDPPVALAAIISPEDASNPEVSWSSSNPSVARVSAGVVTPLSVGVADITVNTADGKFSAVCRVEVKAAPPVADPSVLYGDVTGDGSVDVGDAIIVLRSIVGSVNLSEKQRRAADVNLDEVIDVGDAIIILRHIVGIVPKLPVGHSPKPVDPDPPVAPDPEPPEPPAPIMEPATQRLISARYQVSPTAQVEVSTLNVRTGPGTTYDVIGTVSKGQRFIVLREQETQDKDNILWYQINFRGRDGWIAARFTSVQNILYGLDFWSNPIRLTDAPQRLLPGIYRIDSGFRFSYLDQNGALLPTEVAFDFLGQIPYTRLLLDRPATDTINADFLAQAAQRVRPGTEFTTIAPSFLRAQQLWGVNALYLMAHAALESNWGGSLIAQEKNNIFGFMAFDHDPVGSAATFRSMEDSVLHVSGYIRRSYLNKSGRFYRGAHLAGMNELYATDPMWAIKIARIMQNIYCFSGYSTAEKELNRGVVTANPSLNLRREPGTGHPVVTTMPEGTPVKISGVRLVSDTVWVNLSASDHSGWASGDFVELQTEAKAAVYFFDWFKEGNGDLKVELRENPGAEYPSVGTLEFGRPLKLLAWRSVREGDRWQIWYRVTCPSSALQGWLRSDAIVIKW